MSRAVPPILAAAAGLAVLAGAHAAHAQPPSPGPAPTPVADPACASLAVAGLFPDATVSSASGMMSSTAGVYCEVTATLSPVPGSHIGVVYRLPSNWSGRLVGYGGGGWAGNVGLQTVSADLARGYATMQTDGGHANPNAFDASWTAPGGKPDAVALTDFSWRAVHQMTVTGKLVAQRFYGHPQEVALFQGCSTGGRMALMEAQRFPEDYDGIVAGAPVYSLRVQLAEIYRDWAFSQPGAALQPAHIKLIHDAVLASCDALDGVKDGIVSDPGACRFDPASLKCKSGQAADACLNDAQITAVRRVYENIKGPNGQTYVYGYTRGSEPAWQTFQNITADPKAAATARDLALRAIMFGDPAFSFAAFDVLRDSPRAEAGAFAKEYEAADPDLKPFLARGGKLILWHGLDDQGPSPWGTLAYYEQMKAQSGPLAAAHTRLFLAPGVLHCAGGPGPSQIDFLGAMDRWVKIAVDPDQITASKPRPPANAPQAPFTAMVRPVCAYPAKARYDGKGDPNVEASFACK
jgi:feruloyl esterase